MELLNNEYHLIGPVASAMKPNGCSLDCEGRISKVKNRKIRKTFVDRDENLIGEPRFYSTRISADERNADYRDTEEFDTEELLPSCDCNDTSDIRDDRQQRITGIREIERRDERAEPIPGPSRDFVRTVSPTPVRKAKEPRLEDRIVQHADENGEEETTTEEDLDCTCDTNGVTQITRDEPSRRRPLDRTRIVIRNQRNGQRRENEEEEEDEEDEEDEEVEEEDEEVEEEDTEDSAYRELRARDPRRRRNAAHERELKRWIRRCRRECERRRAR